MCVIKEKCIIILTKRITNAAIYFKNWKKWILTNRYNLALILFKMFFWFMVVLMISSIVYNFMD